MKEMEEDTLYQHLHKLPPTTSEQTLHHILTLLWSTRRTGLQSPDKSRIQSLLTLPQLDPVLACLRSLIRKCVYHSFTSDELLRLFPPDVSLNLQSLIVLLLQRYQSQWKEEASRDKSTLPSYQVRASVPSTFPSLPSSDVSAPLWTNQDYPNGHVNHSDIRPSTSIIPDSSSLHCVPFSVQDDVGTLENLAVIPRLRSMTWTVEDHSTTAPANRVAIIHLKLQDYSKSSSGEVEVKFQLTRDTLDAMLRSLTYIGEQLSGVNATSLGPAQKKQKQ